MLAQVAFHESPDVLNWVQIRAVGGLERQHLDLIIYQPLRRIASRVYTSVVLLEVTLTII